MLSNEAKLNSLISAMYALENAQQELAGAEEEYKELLEEFNLPSDNLPMFVEEIKELVNGT